MLKRVFVTGIGIISAIGKNVEENLQSLMDGKSGLGFLQFIDSIYKDEIPVCEVKYSNKDLMDILGLKTRRPLSRTTLLGVTAAQEAFRNSKLEKRSKTKIGLISATTVGGMDITEKYFDSIKNKSNKGSIGDIIGHDCADSTEKIADFLGLSGYLATISTACSSSANAIMLGAMLIKNGRLNCVIAGGTDSLTKFTINGFNSLMILERNHCRPFDENRNGLNIGEGAGYVVLESEESIGGSNVTPLCELTGYGNACDAYHQTASSPEGDGAFLSMKKAMEISGLNTQDIDYINAHGTGTKNNDLSEGRAIERIFQKEIPPTSSTKPFTGHTLGASGGIESVLSVISIKENILYQNLNFSEQMKELSFKPLDTMTKKIKVNNVLSNSFGFGGNNSSLIFSRV